MIKWLHIMYYTISLTVILLLTVHYFKYQSGKYYYVSKQEKDLIDYFNEIALGSEVGGLTRVTRRWIGPVRIYIEKTSACEKQLAYINKSVQEINASLNSRYYIEIVENPGNANCILILSTLSELKQNKPSFARFIRPEYYGYFRYKHKHNLIYGATVFINTSAPYPIQKNAILEELTQVLGLGNDSEIYQNSVFYIDKYDKNINTHTLSDMDKILIETLYHPKMKTGLNRIETEKIIKKILRNHPDEIATY